jgi:hypothetical protein
MHFFIKYRLSYHVNLLLTLNYNIIDKGVVIVSDSGNIDIGSNLGTPRLPAASEKKLITDNTELSNSSSNKSKTVRNENKSVYKNNANSQEYFIKSNLDKDQNVSEKPKGFNYSPQDPILESKLVNRKPIVVNNNKLRKAPPEPSIRVKLSPKGVAINPRRVQPNIPGRLKSFFDDRIKMLDKLNHALKDEGLNDDSINLITNNSDKLFGLNGNLAVNPSIAEILGFSEDIVERPLNEIVAFLEDGITSLNDEDLQFFVKGIIQQLSHSNYFLASLLQLFMPLPLPFLFAEIDDEFKDDEEELYQDDDEDFFKEEEDDKDEEDEQDEEMSMVSLSIKTKNFSKMHFIIKYYKKSNKIKIAIKGDPSATEIAIPIETNLEEVLEDDIEDIDYFLCLWNDSIIRTADTRILKVISCNSVDKVVLKACNSILKTLSESDIELDEATIADDDYKMF